MTGAELGFTIQSLESTDEFIQTIKDTRLITDRISAKGLPCFPSGQLYLLWEQFIDVRRYTVLSLVYVMLGALLTSFLFLWHPGAVLIMGITIFAIVFEVMGMLYWLGLKMNGVSVVNLVMGVGVAVEFTAHITRLFMLTPGTNPERAEKALAKMSVPVAFGGISTFIGVVPLAFAKFGYFQLYFFQQYVLILALGMYNGLFFLPVMLMLFGPPPLQLPEGEVVPDAAPEETEKVEVQMEKVESTEPEKETSGEKVQVHTISPGDPADPADLPYLEPP